MANFQTWGEDKLRDYIRFVGKDPKNKPHDELVLKAVKVYSADQQSLPRFEAHWAQSHGAPGQPMPGGMHPTMGGGPTNLYPMPGGPANPYPSVAYPGPTPGAGQYPIPGANPYGGSQPMTRAPGPNQYPNLDFTAPAAAGSNAYPSFHQGGGGMPPGAPLAAAPNPYPAPGGGGMPPGAPPAAAPNPYPAPGGGGMPPGSAPAVAPNPYPAPGGGPSPGTAFPAPLINHSSPAPSNPYPAPGGSPVPGSAFPAPLINHSSSAPSNPYPTPGGGPAPGSTFPATTAASNPYPSPAQPSAPAINQASGSASNPYPMPGGAAPSGAFPGAVPTGNPYPSPLASAAPTSSAPANPYPAPGGPAPQPAGNPYPTPGGASAPPTGTPSNPYPEPGMAGAPAVNPYGALPADPAAPSSNLYPTANFPTPGTSQDRLPNAQQQQHPGLHPQQHQQQHPGAHPQHPGMHPGAHQQRPQQHHPQQQQQQPQHHVQQATGRKKALLVGCNYPGSSAELRGCCTDVQHIEYLLKTRFGFQDITVLRDDLHRDDVMPTKRNILAHIDRLVHGAQPGDSLFFHFSGHGSQKRDYSGDESDGMNETLVPTDYEHAGQLVDDELNKRLVNPLPQGVRLHALLDACHSGTGLDLPYVTKMEKGSGRLYWVSEGPTRVYKGTRGGLAVQFGACKDSQLAQDTAALSGGTHTGAATYLFIQAVEQLIGQNQPLTYGRIISEMLHQIKEFQKKQSGGRGLEQNGSTRSGLGGMLTGMLINGAISSVLGGGGGGAGGLLSALMGGGQMKGQTPQLSCSDTIDLNMPMML